MWLYKKSFTVDLEPKRLKFIRKGQNIESIIYDAPKDFKRETMVQVLYKMENNLVSEPGGHASKRPEMQGLLDGNNHLLLPSGISPYHDVVVPAELLKSDPHYTLELRGQGVWQNRAASTLLEKVNGFNQRKAEGGNAIYKDFRIEEWKRTIGTTLVASLIEKNDPDMKTLADFITRNIPRNDHRKRIMAIVRFVQAYGHKAEYDTNFDRPGLITLFNGGSDCNNLTDLFVQLMQAAGYDSSVFYVAFKNNESVLHLKGGIPAQYFPGKITYNMGKNRWVAIELNGLQGFNPGQNGFSDEKTYFIDEISAKK